jgi:hypothetical protein
MRRIRRARKHQASLPACRPPAVCPPSRLLAAAAYLPHPCDCTVCRQLRS